MNYLRNIKDRLLKIYGKEPESLDELARCVIKVISEQKSTRDASSRKCNVVGFCWDIVHSPRISNTHSSPIDGVTNWGSKPDKPTGYPGWTGRVWIRYEQEYPTFSSDPFSATLTHPGTGGFGSYNGPWEQISTAYYKRHGHKVASKFNRPAVYSWDYRFYQSDWPVLSDEINKLEMFHKLAGTNTNKKHYFLWEDSDQKIKDAEFIADCALQKARETA